MEVKYAGFWARFAACMVDSMWVVVLMYAPIGLVAYFEWMDSDSTAYLLFYLFVQYILPAIIYVWFWSKYQATPGKIAVRIKIVDANTLEKASLRKYCLRYFGYFISMILLFIGYIWVGIDKRKRGFHDYIGGTVVVFY